jgi:hypothetical protein
VIEKVLVPSTKRKPNGSVVKCFRLVQSDQEKDSSSRMSSHWSFPDVDVDVAEDEDEQEIGGTRMVLPQL